LTQRMEKSVKTELDRLTEIILKTVPVETIYLFGSYADGTPHKDSDLDIFVVMKDGTDMREIEAGILIRRAIARRKTMPVDILVEKHRSWLERKILPSIERHIASKGKLLYGQG